MFNSPLWIHPFSPSRPYACGFKKKIFFSVDARNLSIVLFFKESALGFIYTFIYSKALI